MEVPFDELIGKTITKIEGAEKYSSQITFHTDEGIFRQSHLQDCCETVEVEDICGDIEALLGSPICLAEEVTHVNENPPEIEVPYDQESYTWTFYKLSTIKGSVTIRWYGASNGYYSESVYFERISPI